MKNRKVTKQSLQYVEPLNTIRVNLPTKHATNKGYSTSFNYFNGVFFSNAAKREWRRCDCSASGDSRAFLFASMKGGALSQAVLGDLYVLSYFINLKPDCKDLKA